MLFRSVQFRKARIEDIDAIVFMYQKAIETMIEHKIYQWDEIYPERSILTEDIQLGQLYLGVCDHTIACAYVINKIYDEEYKNGNWKYPDASFHIIHRLCVNVDFQGKGLGRITVKHIEKQLRDMKIDSIRLDAFTQNPSAVAMYEKLGYQTVGVANLRKGKFFLMEKYLDDSTTIKIYN